MTSNVLSIHKVMQDQKDIDTRNTKAVTTKPAFLIKASFRYPNYQCKYSDHGLKLRTNLQVKVTETQLHRKTEIQPHDAKSNYPLILKKKSSFFTIEFFSNSPYSLSTGPVQRFGCEFRVRIVSRNYFFLSGDQHFSTENECFRLILGNYFRRIHSVVLTPSNLFFQLFFVQICRLFLVLTRVGPLSLDLNVSTVAI